MIEVINIHKRYRGRPVLNGVSFTVLFHKNGIPMTAVVDTTNGDIVYKGEVVTDGNTSESKEHMKTVQFINMQISE